MSLSKLIITVALLGSFCDKAYSQNSPAEKPKAVTSAKKKATSLKRFSFGLGFMNFGESLQITESNFKNVGFANYAGLVAMVDYTVTKHRWIYQFSGGIASGKASAGGFSTIMYSDSGRRTWMMTFLEFAAHYRVHSRISFGGGMIAGNRSADWKSEANPLIQSKQLNKVIYAPEFITRLGVSRNVTLIQSIASPDFRGNTIWRWSVNYTL